MESMMSCWNKDSDDYHCQGCFRFSHKKQSATIYQLCPYEHLVPGVKLYCKKQSVEMQCIE